MNFSMRFKLASLLAVFGILISGLTGYYSYSSSLTMLLNAAERDLLTATQVLGRSLQASLDYSKIQKDIRVAQYQQSIQSAFQEVSDGLAARQTYQQQLQAQRDLVSANQEYYRLAERRYLIGVDSSLTFLVAQRALFKAQQSLIIDRLAQLGSEVNLYKALGGGWLEPDAPVNKQRSVPAG